MPAWLSVIWYDLKNAWDSLEPVDFAMPSFIGLWIIILFMPLFGIDRRDPIAGLMYVLFCSGAGVALVFALPQNYAPPRTMNLQITTVLFMGGVSAFRWFYGANPDILEEQRKQMEIRHKEKEKEKERKKSGKPSK